MPDHLPWPGIFESLPGIMFPNKEPIWEEKGDQPGQKRIVVERAAVLHIGRIGKDQIEAIRRWFLKIGLDVRLPDVSLQMAMDEVVPDALDRFLVLLDKCRRRRAPAERLDAEGAGARVEIKHAGTGNPFRQAGEDHLPDAVLRRTQRMALRRFQMQAAGGAGDDAEGHGLRGTD